MNKVAAKIAKFVTQHTGKKAIHVPNSYEAIKVSRASMNWGFPQGIVIDNYHVACSQPSPRHKGDEAIAYFDYYPVSTSEKSYSTIKGIYTD